MAVANRLGGLAFGLLEAFFVKLYQYVVDPAPAGSWPFHVFLYLAKGPFKCGRCVLFWHVCCGDLAATHPPTPCSCTLLVFCLWAVWVV